MQKCKNMSPDSRKAKNRKSKKSNKKTESRSDSRFAGLEIPAEKAPPVDMFGRPISPDSFAKYESSSDESESEIEMLVPEPMSEQEDVYGDQTSDTLAIVNLPWKKITAKDIFSIVSKVIGEKASYLKNVTVYLSNYGKEHPEQVEEPPEDIDEEVQIAMWRKKEKEEMKRYFAILYFEEGSGAGEYAYKELQNCEVETTGSFFDVSYVVGQTFENFEVRDSADSIPDNWELPDMESDFLNKTKPEDDWDANPKERQNAIDLIWSNLDGDIDDRIVAQIMGSGSEDETHLSREDMQDTINVLNEEEEQDDFNISSDEESDSDKEIEVTFKQNLNIKQEPNEKPISKKAKKEAEKRPEADAETIKDVVQDPRFASLFNKPGYGIDSADPKFKRTKEMETFMNEVSKKQHQKTDDIKEQQTNTKTNIESTVDRIKKRAQNQK